MSTAAERSFTASRAAMMGRPAATVTSSRSLGTIGGTPQYLSPEQINNFAALGPSADIYSLGVVMYHMCTGPLPFEQDELGPLLIMHLTHKPESPRVLNPHLPDTLEEIILATLEKDPAKRPASCRDLAAQISLVRESFA